MRAPSRWRVYFKGIGKQVDPDLLEQRSDRRWIAAIRSTATCGMTIRFRRIHLGHEPPNKLVRIDGGRG